MLLTFLYYKSIWGLNPIYANISYKNKIMVSLKFLTNNLFLKFNVLKEKTQSGILTGFWKWFKKFIQMCLEAVDFKYVFFLLNPVEISF